MKFNAVCGTYCLYHFHSSASIYISSIRDRSPLSTFSRAYSTNRTLGGGAVKEKHTLAFINIDFKLVDVANLTPGCNGTAVARTVGACSVAGFLAQTADTLRPNPRNGYQMSVVAYTFVNTVQHWDSGKKDQDIWWKSCPGEVCWEEFRDEVDKEC